MKKRAGQETLPPRLNKLTKKIGLTQAQQELLGILLAVEASGAEDERDELLEAAEDRPLDDEEIARLMEIHGIS